MEIAAITIQCSHCNDFSQGLNRMEKVASYNRASAIAFCVLGSAFCVPVLTLFNMNLAGKIGLSNALITMASLGGVALLAALVLDVKLKAKFKRA